jgi:hypothetical protein
VTVETITGAQTKATTAETNAKAYIDGLLTGVIRTTARLAATANVNISSPGATFDGTTAANGNRVLLPAQTTGTQNGIYIFNGAASAMTRATDFDTSAEFGHGMLVSVPKAFRMPELFSSSPQRTQSPWVRHHSPSRRRPEALPG